MAKLPGIGTEVEAVHREVLATRNGALFLPGGRIIEGAYARDSGNTGNLSTLQAGTLMGIETTGRKYRPSILGVLQVNASPATTITVTPAQAVEIVRRVGPQGNLNVIGPTSSTPTTMHEANNKAYTIVDIATGEITIESVGSKLAGCLVSAVDGTKYPRTFIADPYGIKVTDENEANIDAAFEQVLIAGIIKFSQLIIPASGANATTIATVTAWIKEKLRIAVPGLVFDDDF